MNGLLQPATSKVDVALFSLAVSGINRCEACVCAHEEAVVAGGLTPDHVNDAMRIATTLAAAAVALEMGPAPRLVS
jgi:alkyl hydroperoxide reductase subunit D